MKQRVQMMSAPVAMQPGKYIPRVYGEKPPATAEVDLEVQQQGNGWQIDLVWAAATPVHDKNRNPRIFVDGAAIFVPEHADAPWISMGAPGQPLSGLLWRPDRNGLTAMAAEGLGSTQRSDAPAGWKADGQWRNGFWHLSVQIDQWAALDRFQKLAFAIWQGSKGERAGIKSVSPGWLSVKHV